MPKLPLTPGLPLRPPAWPHLAKPVHVDVSQGRFRLRTAKVEDASAAVAAWMSDPVVIAGLNGTGQPMSLEQLRGYIAGFDNIRKNLTIIRSVGDERPIGFLMFDIEPRHKIGTFHILIGDRRERVGEASYTAVRLVLKHLFETRGVEKVLIEPLSRNRAVVMYCDWLGFRLEGILKSHRLDSRTDARLDQHVFGMTKEEYANWPNRIGR
jgi:RimJ/RimL family protein N-acetyltransferase